MTDRRAASPSRSALTAAGLVLVVLAVGFALTRRGPDDARLALPTDCGATPAAYHPGTLVDRPAPDAEHHTRRRGGASSFVRVRFDSGRMVLAYDARAEPTEADSRVVVAEYRCVHRTIHMLTELGAPPAGEKRSALERGH